MIDVIRVGVGVMIFETYAHEIKVKIKVAIEIEIETVGVPRTRAGQVGTEINGAGGGAVDVDADPVAARETALFQ